jgi:hypothetical protein
VSEASAVEEDPVLDALANLSDAAKSSVSHLNALHEELAVVRAHRLHGWTWRRILADADLTNPLSSLTRVMADLARASGGFRRALAVGLRREGMKVTEIASHFDVSRQRVSALVRSHPAEDANLHATDSSGWGVADTA